MSGTRDASLDPQAVKADALRGLHAAPDILVLPNAWDPGSARIFAQAGFPAIATTSSGIAHAHGLPDGQRIHRDVMLAAVDRIVSAVNVPVTADLEAGYGETPEDIANTVQAAIRVGAVGCNLEDSTRNPEHPLVDVSRAAERFTAARAGAAAAGVPMVINARTDVYLLGDAFDGDPFRETVARAAAYREAGADCIFVPGVRDSGVIAELVRAIDAPVNILAGPGSPSVAELHALGVARVSIGGSLMRAALTLIRRAAAELRTDGTYTYADGALSHADLNALFDA